LLKGLAFCYFLHDNENDYYLGSSLLKLSQAQAGKKYKVESLLSLKSLSKRLAILGLNTGVLIELLALYKHGAIVKTACGKVALGADLLDAIQVTII